MTTASGPRPGTWQAITTPCCAQHLAGDHDAPAAPSVVWHRPPPLTPTAGRSLVNLAKRNISQLAALARTRLKRMPYRPRRINSYLAKTGLGLTLP